MSSSRWLTIGVLNPVPIVVQNATSFPFAATPPRSKLQRCWVEIGGSYWALVNHFDWIKVTKALNNVRGQSGWIKCLCQAPKRVTQALRGL